MKLPACLVLVSLAACAPSSSGPSSSSSGGTDGGANQDATVGGAGDSSAPSDGPTGGKDAGGPGVDAGPCGMTFYPNDYEPSCQLLLDHYCCDQEKACAADTACTTVIACIDACPTPRQDTCINACGTTEPSTLNALAQCTKQPPYTVPAGIDCGWP
jgi:hypothetical protein